MLYPHATTLALCTAAALLPSNMHSGHGMHAYKDLWVGLMCAAHAAAAGHYVSLIKSHSHWLFFDDENVETITESQVQTTFGSTQEYGNNNMDHGYILFYERVQS